jgi:hypothetical protein
MERMIDYLNAARGTDAWHEGKAWYAEANAFCKGCAGRHTVAVERVAGIVAALSPRCTWDANKRWAEELIRCAVNGLPCPPVGLGDARVKAWAIAHGTDPDVALRGLKVRAFYRNLIGDLEAVTIDGWMLKALGLTQGAVRTPARHAIVVRAVTDAAERFNIAPAEAQAIVWVHVRGRAE